MNCNNYSTQKRNFKQLGYESRIIIETLISEHRSVKYIADYLHVNRSTIYREIKRGSIITIDSMLNRTQSYEARAAQNISNNRNMNSHKKLKILGHKKYLEQVRDSIKNDKSSFEIFSGRINHLNSTDSKNRFNVCTKTLYNYLHKGLFDNVGLKKIDLPRIVRYKYHKKYISKAKLDCKGNSIEIRPESVNLRTEPFNWEIDCIIGPKNQGPVLLTLTERLTRFELIFKLEEKTSSNVAEKLDNLEKLLGDDFIKYFKTITSDNGSEFKNFTKIQTSCIDPTKLRTVQYFAHAYCSYERGTNEAMNERIRIFFPKKTNFDNVSNADIKTVQDKLNNQPKKCLKFKTALEAISEISPEFIKLIGA